VKFPATLLLFVIHLCDFVWHFPVLCAPRRFFPSLVKSCISFTHTVFFPEYCPSLSCPALSSPPPPKFFCHPASLLAMQTAVIAIPFLSVRPSVCPSVTFLCFVLTNEHIRSCGLQHQVRQFFFLVSGKVNISGYSQGITPSEGVKVKRPLTLAKIWPIIGHNFETVQDRR